MNTIFGTDYASKATAIRGAKRAGLLPGDFEVQANADGRFAIVAPVEVMLDYLDDASDTTAVDDPAPVEAPAPAPVKRATRQRDVLRVASSSRTKKEFSSVESPVAVCREFFERFPNASRQGAIVSLMAKGIHKSTASTQYHRWHSARAAK